MTNFTVLPIGISEECPAISPSLYGVCLIINIHSDHYYNHWIAVGKLFMTFLQDLFSDYIFQTKIRLFVHYINELNQFRPWKIRYNIKKLGYQDRIIELPNIIDSAPFRFCIGKKSTYVNILSKFDETIKEMKKDGKLQKIYDNYK